MKIKSRIIWTGLAVWLLSSHVVAGELENGIAAIKAGKIGVAVQILEPLAKGGDREAQLQLGAALEKKGEFQNFASAFKWYSLASASGNLEAQSRMAGMYSSGRGVPKNRAEGIRLYRLAADQGDAYSQGALAFAYAAGDGVPKDDVLSYMWHFIALETYTTVGHKEGIHAEKFFMEISPLTFVQKLKAVALANKWKESRPKKKASLVNGSTD